MQHILMNIKQLHIPSSVILLAVLKNRSVPEIQGVLKAGITHLGENRIQEAEGHFKALGPALLRTVTKHFIGHLQSNKVKKVVQLFDVIQTVDSEKLAKTISQEAQKQGKIQEIMIQVNIGKEPQKHGVMPEDVISLHDAIKHLQNVEIIGLMCIPPALPPEQVRLYFKRMKQLQKELRLPQLSMGMSGDYQVAIEEGSTLVRLGRRLFEG